MELIASREEASKDSRDVSLRVESARIRMFGYSVSDGISDDSLAPFARYCY